MLNLLKFSKSAVNTKSADNTKSAVDTKSAVMRPRLTVFLKILTLFFILYPLSFSFATPLNVNYFDADAEHPYLIAPYDRSYILNMAKHKLDSLNRAGYPFAKVILTPVHIRQLTDSLNVDLRVYVKPLQFSRIDALKFNGANQTKPDYLRLESRIKRGDVYDMQRVKSAERRLNRLEFIRTNGSPIVKKSNIGMVNVEFPVRERRVNRLSGFIAYSDGDQNAIGEFEFEMRNLFGTGRRLIFEWSDMPSTGKGIRANYREPWLLGKPLHVEFQIEQGRSETGTVRSEQSTTFEWEASYFTSLSISGAKETVSESNETRDNNYAANWLGLGIKYDNLDYIWNATDGYSASYDVMRGFRKVENARTSLEKHSAQLGRYVPLKRNLVMFLSVQNVVVTGKQLESLDLWHLGGNSSFRGVLEESIFLREASFTTAEFRWRADEFGFVGLFGDGLFTHLLDDRFAHYPSVMWSYGVVGGFEANAGRIELNLALESRQPLSKGRLHVQWTAWW